jgi:hypothetical protein
MYVSQFIVSAPEVQKHTSPSAALQCFYRGHPGSKTYVFIFLFFLAFIGTHGKRAWDHYHRQVTPIAVFELQRCPWAQRSLELHSTSRPAPKGLTRSRLFYS